uniref:Heteropteran venom family 2 protein 11 n=1 Tax=Oncocephalus sp. TaxID=2944721 RepID=A0AB38ZES3_9HEMI
MVAAETAKQLESLPQEVYTARALDELRAMSKSRFLTDLQVPDCQFFIQNYTAQCFLKFRWMKIPRSVGVRVSFNINRIQLKFVLLFDDEEMFEHKIDLAKICTPLPGLLKQIEICGQAYYVDIDAKPPGLSFDICFVIKIGDFFHLRLNCIHLSKDGKFSHHAKYEPEDEGIFMLSIEDGNVKFKLNNPIPKEVMDQIEREWKEFEKKAVLTAGVAGMGIGIVGDKIGQDVTQGINTVGNELNKFGKDVEKGFNKFGKDVEKGVNQLGKDIEKGVNKVGKDIEKGVLDAGKQIKDTFNDIGSKLASIFG